MLWFLLLLSSGHLSRPVCEGEYLCDKVAKLFTTYNPIKCYASGLFRASASRLTIKNINKAINNGGSFFLYAGHGLPFGFFTHPPFVSRVTVPFPIFYYSSDITSLSNTDKLPVAIFSACHCANFDYISAPIAWKFITHETGGAIASLASTTVSLSALTSFTTETYSGFLVMSFFKSYVEKTDILGELWGETIVDYLNDEDAWPLFVPVWYHFLVLEEWILFGDPSLKIGGYQ